MRSTRLAGAVLCALLLFGCGGRTEPDQPASSTSTTFRDVQDIIVEDGVNPVD